MTTANIVEKKEMMSDKELFDHFYRKHSTEEIAEAMKFDRYFIACLSKINGRYRDCLNGKIDINECPPVDLKPIREFFYGNSNLNNEKQL